MVGCPRGELFRRIVRESSDATRSMNSLNAEQNSLPPSACNNDMVLAASGAFEILGALCFVAAIIPSAKQPKLFWVLWLLSFMLFGRASFGETPVGLAWLYSEVVCL